MPNGVVGITTGWRPQEVASLLRAPPNAKHLDFYALPRTDVPDSKRFGADVTGSQVGE